jgi:N-sulfoglucosamine sulfohydrolase
VRALLWLLLACLPAVGGAAGAAARPHLVLFVADDYSWHDCGAYGAKDVRTPNLDRLAKEGMRFEAAFAASPTCTPSRSSIFTGLYPFRSGAHANHSLVKDDVRTLPHRLKELGYRVVLAGKTHIGPRPAFPFEYLAGSNVMPPGKSHVLWTDLDTAAVDRLLAMHDRKEPLCLIVASHSPHVYWPENQAYDPESLTLPPYLVDTPETRRARAEYYTDVTWMDRQLGEVRASLAKHGYTPETLFLFTADQGAQWPFAKWNLYDAGIRAPLLAAWPGKIKPAAETSAMVSLVDLMPTFIEAAGGPAPADIDGRSFLPVLLGSRKTHREEVFSSHTGDGQMNRTPMRGIRTARWKYILNLAPATRYRTHIDGGQPVDGKGYWQSWTQRAQADAGAAAVVRHYQQRPAEELFDVRADPYELRDLASEPRRAEVLKDLREKLKNWRLQQGEDLSKVPLPEDARTGEVPYAR